jgi:prepilin peptidase CpaA
MIHTLSWIIPTLILAVAVVEDLRTKKVRNVIVLGMIVVALVGAIGIDGVRALPWSALSMTTAFLLGFPLFVLGILGAGDIKVFIAVSVLLSWDAVLFVGVASLLWGAALGVARTVIAGEGKTLVTNTWGLIRYQKKLEPTQLHFIPFTVALAFAWLSYLAQIEPWRNL